MKSMRRALAWLLAVALCLSLSPLSLAAGTEADRAEAPRTRPGRGERESGDGMATQHDISITADVPGIGERTRTLIRLAVRTALRVEGMELPCEVDILLTDDAGIRLFNREQRNVDAPTDVLSFPAFQLAPGDLPGEAFADVATGRIPLGDMVISVERAAAQAREYGHSRERELAYLAVHSVLHLLGYDHLDEGPEKQLMRAHEEAVMGELGLEREERSANS